MRLGTDGLVQSRRGAGDMMAGNKTFLEEPDHVRCRWGILAGTRRHMYGSVDILGMQDKDGSLRGLFGLLVGRSLSGK
jgi:hypothetical protein